MEFFDFDWRDYSNAYSAAFRGARALVGGLLRTWRLRKWEMTGDTNLFTPA